MESCTIIGIAGGTGSGKTTFTNKLKDYFGDSITVIYHDNYYKDRQDLSIDERKRLNFDHPASLETDLLVQHLNRLKNGQKVTCPVYDYVEHIRADQTMTIYPKKVVIVEGILTLHEPLLRDLFDIKIYVEADADVRILRRAQRDMKERGRELDTIVEQYLSSVKPMHSLYVEPTRKYADVVINSGMNAVAFDLIKTKVLSLIR